MRMLQQPSQMKSNGKKTCAVELKMCEFIMVLPAGRDYIVKTAGLHL